MYECHQWVYFNVCVMKSLDNCTFPCPGTTDYIQNICNQFLEKKCFNILSLKCIERFAICLQTETEFLEKAC